MLKIAGVAFKVQSVAATRFAPSPNGLLHVGHAFAAMCAHDFARRFGGRFHLRIEDIDGTRSKAAHSEAIQADLRWLGLHWDGPVIFQSQRTARYAEALDQLKLMGLVYRCWCTRGEIARGLKKQPVLHGPDGPIYPGTCRGVTRTGDDYCWRLDMAAARDHITSPSSSGEGLGLSASTAPSEQLPPPSPPLKRRGELTWTDLAAGPQQADPMLFGDVVLWRKDAPASYHLAATLDDAADGISHVVRGMDLFAYTAVHRLLQALLDLPEPVYWHHPLLLDDKGEKLAKSRLSKPLAQLRDAKADGPALVQALRAGKLPLGISSSSA
jgi:glutamyl-Q tRNA(Asp) synthetase